MAIENLKPRLSGMVFENLLQPGSAKLSQRVPGKSEEARKPRTQQNNPDKWVHV
jgi:hypothetical protein